MEKDELLQHLADHKWHQLEVVHSYEDGKAMATVKLDGVVLKCQQVKISSLGPDDSGQSGV